MIKFYAKSNLLVKVPGSMAGPGQAELYVGRVFDPESRGYPASRDGYEVDENSSSGQRLIRLTRIDDSLWPADEHTASVCGVQYVPVEFKDGYFAEAKKTPTKSKEV